LDAEIIHGPTGETLLGLPSPYQPHANGLLHLPRFLAKIKKHLDGALPKSYQRNFTKGFDGFLCLHLGVEPQQIIDLVKSAADQQEIDTKLEMLLPDDLRAYEWNRRVVQIGMSDMALEKLQEIKSGLGVGDREDLRSFADVIDYDEKKIP
jgi:hypothetical protein